MGPASSKRPSETPPAGEGRTAKNTFRDLGSHPFDPHQLCFLASGMGSAFILSRVDLTAGDLFERRLTGKPPASQRGAAPDLFTAASQHFSRGKAVGAAGFPLSKSRHSLSMIPLIRGILLFWEMIKEHSVSKGSWFKIRMLRSEGCRLPLKSDPCLPKLL